MEIELPWALVAVLSAVLTTLGLVWRFRSPGGSASTAGPGRTNGGEEEPDTFDDEALNELDQDIADTDADHALDNAVDKVLRDLSTPSSDRDDQ